MFEVGKRYEIRMIVGGDETTMWRTIEKYEHPLVKFTDIDVNVSLPKIGDGDIEYEVQRHRAVGEIINVTSPNFISATLKE